MLKFTFNYVLRKNSVGSYAVYADYSINKVRDITSLGIKVDEKNWDYTQQRLKPTHHKFTEDNLKLEIFYSSIYEPIRNARLGGLTSPIILQNKTQVNVFEFVTKWIDDLKRQNRSQKTIDNHTGLLNKLKIFVTPKLGDKPGDYILTQTPALTFDQVNEDFIKKYETHLNSTIKKRKEGVSGYTNLIFINMNTWFKAAHKKGVLNTNPLENYQYKKVTTEEKEYLTKEELQLWESFIPSLKRGRKEAAIYFLLECYSGLRISDLRLFDVNKNIQNNVIRLRPQKTQNSSGAWVEMEIYPGLKRILDYVKVMPLTIDYDSGMNSYLKTIAKQLNFNKHVSTHVGRKTFAVTICQENGVSCGDCAAFMGITEEMCRDSYYRTTNTRLQEVGRKAFVNT